MAGETHAPQLRTSPEYPPHQLRTFFDDTHTRMRLQHTAPRIYKNVFALLLRWQDDDLGTAKEIDNLELLLQDTYQYQTERYVIPSKDPRIHLEGKLNEFKKAHDDENNLQIVYYGGHGSLERHDRRPSRSIWQSRQRGGSKLVWSDMQGMFDNTLSDVVFVLDCCYAATASRSGGSIEGLWASNSEVTTPGVYDNSFTENLIEELKSLSDTRFNVAMLHGNMMKRYRKLEEPSLRTEPWYTNLGDTPTLSAELTSLRLQRTTCMGTALPTNQSRKFIVAAWELRDTAEIPDLSSFLGELSHAMPDEVDSLHIFGVEETNDLSRLAALSLSNTAIVEGEMRSEESGTAPSRLQTNTLSSVGPNTVSDTERTSVSDAFDYVADHSKGPRDGAQLSHSLSASALFGPSETNGSHQLKRRHTFPVERSQHPDKTWFIHSPKRRCSYNQP